MDSGAVYKSSGLRCQYPFEPPCRSYSQGLNGSIQAKADEALNRIMTASTHKSLVTVIHPNRLDMYSKFETARGLH